jgi:hypothetical protein
MTLSTHSIIQRTFQGVNEHLAEILACVSSLSTGRTVIEGANFVNDLRQRSGVIPAQLVSDCNKLTAIFGVTLLDLVAEGPSVLFGDIYPTPYVEPASLKSHGCHTFFRDLKAAHGVLNTCIGSA